MTAQLETTRRRIVVGVDGSKPSIDSLRWAQRMGIALDAEIDAVLVWQYPLSYGASAYIEMWDPATDAAKVLGETVQEAFGDDIPAGLTTLITHGHPAHVLTEASADAQLLVVGSRGHGGFVGMLIGATSAYCAEHATCTVLVTHGSP